MNIEEKIVQTALAVLRSGRVVPCIPGLAARRTTVERTGARASGRNPLVLESGGMPVIPPSSRREVRI